MCRCIFLLTNGILDAIIVVMKYAGMPNSPETYGFRSACSFYARSPAEGEVTYDINWVIQRKSNYEFR